jgi:hypothetical protein
VLGEECSAVRLVAMTFGFLMGASLMLAAIDRDINAPTHIRSPAYFLRIKLKALS